MPRILAAALVAAALHGPAVRAETLTLETAVARALAAAPENAVAEAQRNTLRAARGLAGTRPAPAVEVLAENFAGTGPYMVDRSEVTASYAPVIERGGKREARIALAETDLAVAEAEAAARRLETAALAQRGYVEVQAAEAALRLARERLEVARSLAREVGRRVASARDPLFAGTRADSLVAEALVDIELAEHARDAALGRLTALWGGSAEGVSVHAEDFLRFGQGASAEAALATSELALMDARIRRAEAGVANEKARAKPDLTVRGGVRYLAESNDVALVAGLSLPLARRETARLAQERAVGELSRAEADRVLVRTLRLRELRLAEERVEEARHEAVAVRDRILPGLRRTLQQVGEGYARGGFTYNDLHQAQLALAEANARLVRAATAYHEAGVERDRLTGRFAGRQSEEIAQ